MPCWGILVQGLGPSILFFCTQSGICWLSKKKIEGQRLGKGLYGKIPTKEEPIRMLGCTSRLLCHIIVVKIHASILVSMHTKVKHI